MFVTGGEQTQSRCQMVLASAEARATTKHLSSALYEYRTDRSRCSVFIRAVTAALGALRLLHNIGNQPPLACGITLPDANVSAVLGSRAFDVEDAVAIAEIA